MPKEHIYTAGVSSPYEVQVGWQADRDVQLGVEMVDIRSELPEFTALPDRRSLLWQLFGSSENLLRFGHELSEFITRRQDSALAAQAAQTSDEWDQRCEHLAIEVILMLQDKWCPTGVWSILTREDCNRLIKTLRRARDSAYGKDE